MRENSMNANNDHLRPNFLRLKHVLARTGMSRSTVYAYVREGRFPAPISISTRCVAWIEDDIDAWIAERISNGRRA
jgi:prophage regulatory protein